MSPSNYSFIDDHVAGSAQPLDIDDIKQYLADDITHMISLTPNQPLVTRYLDDIELDLYHLPIYGVPDDSQIIQFLDIVDVAKKTDGKVVIHCQFGQERTGMLLAIYLVEHKGMSIHEAIHRIRDVRPGSLQSAAALNYLLIRYDDQM